jgi:quercetin dioxygenase-like cupin family protein
VGFYRFENLKSHHFNPHLSTTQGPVIEGQYMYFRRVTKQGGTRSKPHYHPNEFMAFLLEGRTHAVLGRGRRVAGPGTLVHIPSNARHSFLAIDDIKYLYVKDRTWTLIGAAANEALPEQAMSATQVAKALKSGKYPGRRGTARDSGAIVDGLGNCFYKWMDGIKAPPISGRHEQWLEGLNLAFGVVDAPVGHVAEEKRAAHEIFAYVLSGTIDAAVGAKRHRARVGDVIHVPRGSSYRWEVTKDGPARYAAVRSTAHLEAAIQKNGAADNWRG